MREKLSATAIDSIDDLRKNINELMSQLQKQIHNSNDRKKITQEVEKATIELKKIMNELDPIELPSHFFDPGNPKTIGFFVALALTAQERNRLNAIKPRYGSGVYALYYTGEFPLYSQIRDSETPIYIGKAETQTEFARTPKEQENALSKRLSDHARTIDSAKKNLSIDDFEYRALVVQTGWESSAESHLIRLFHPIWNKETDIVQGFGKHGDNTSGTRKNKVSSWDVLHPGRKNSGAGINPNQKEIPQITLELSDHFETTKIFHTKEDVISSFLDGLRQ